jgi:hypothetical protein
MPPWPVPLAVSAVALPAQTAPVTTIGMVAVSAAVCVGVKVALRFPSPTVALGAKVTGASPASEVPASEPS